MAVPREIFEELMAPLTEDDTVGLRRNSTTDLIEPTNTKAAPHHYRYTIKRGSVSDKMFKLDSLDEPPPPPKAKLKSSTSEMLQIGDQDCYEVDSILDKRTVRKRTQYLIKWKGWDESSNTWEYASSIHPDLVRAYEGKPPRISRRQPRVLAPLQFKRGVGCARARLSVASQKRGYP